VEQFKYLGTYKKKQKQNSIHEEIKNRLKLGSDFYHYMKNLLSFSLLSKNIEITVHTSTNLPVLLYGC